MSEEMVTISAEGVGELVLDPLQNRIDDIDAQLVALTNQKMAIREEQRLLTLERDGLVRDQLLAKEQERLRGVLGEDVQIVRAGTIATG